ncbi:BURP domain protein RD22-like isoform X2 [Papaver somniferum]|uniref:BURP domain protein RD22-like isoform X2 n=1 Tax=Papaver somniferum TaxID=3469 RepID=UPI000E6F6DEE|nr:BURP domain protein RD22-like isoform X2 [Papaver somniferum]
MELLLVLISASCLLVGAVGNHAALPSEIYWINKLPNTLMPIMLHDLLHPDQEGKPLTDVRAAGPSPGSRYTPKHRNTIDQGGKPSTDVDKAGSSFRNNAATFSNDVDKAAYPIPTVRYSSKHRNTIQNQFNLTLSKSTISNQLNLQKYSKNPPLGKNRVDNRQLQYNPGVSLFFLEKDLHPGAKMNLQFVVSTASGTTFLPQKLAKVTPLSSDKLQEILNQFAINSKSKEAELIDETITNCEAPAMENEEKFCATSLESLVEYGTSKFGKNVNVLTTEIYSDKGQRTQMRKQQYVVSSGVRQIVSDNLVVCHSLPYLYAVFYCHATSAHTSQAYVVLLVGADGIKIKATVVCHKDTSKWDPDHVAFQVLKVKPGTVPICHFLTEDTIVWVAKNKDN